MHSELIVVLHLLLLRLLRLTVMQQPVTHHISVLVVHAHQSQTPEANVDQVHKQERLQHALHQGRVEVRRWDTEDDEQGNSLVDPAERQTDYHADPQYLLEGSRHSVEQGQTVRRPSQHVRYEGECSCDDHEVAEPGFEGEEVEDEWPHCTPRAVRETGDPVERHEQDHQGQNQE